ncbi:DUF5007 domain-containing protein [Pedobacter sp. ISL-68]|uniref:DUF5007 domain-containing protein n=1 Tax=unclassified Pedobacter TaxID=2628915 RepID=UPI001BEA17FF|nr:MULTISPECIES: DUF5007 domain-containing protein [unclassified Pedobacter]MBT2564171.1 DUF5007 domain-containing protein [Pedobacter sp. ISL-64]MBT2589694.1 DUF5007 domain-containing protein [Pedobacter sp. ISL-68]
MMKNIQYILKVSLTLLLGGIVLYSCKKNLPDERLSIANDSQYTQYVYQPVLGRNTLFANNFQYGNSSRPLDFKIVNMRTFNGEPAPELTNNYPVTVWKTAYDGTEKSIAEIEAKRTTENHPLFEVRPHSGEFMMWAAANSNMVKAQPDSGYVFDVEMSNSGGRKYFQNFRLRPLRERPYEPSNLDPVTGQGTSVSVNPTSLNITGLRGQPLNTRDDVQVLFKKAGNGNSITFKFVDTLSNPIDPNKFAATDWPNLVHGFNMVKDATKVKYEVAYPIPCSAYPTKYTTLSGDQARVVFRFNRQAFGNVLQQCFLAFNFNIYQKGDWEITFWFKRDKPKFDND